MVVNMIMAITIFWAPWHPGSGPWRKKTCSKNKIMQHDNEGYRPGPKIPCTYYLPGTVESEPWAWTQFSNSIWPYGACYSWVGIGSNSPKTTRDPGPPPLQLQSVLPERIEKVSAKRFRAFGRRACKFTLYHTSMNETKPRQQAGLVVRY